MNVVAKFLSANIEPFTLVNGKVMVSEKNLEKFFDTFDLVFDLYEDKKHDLITIDLGQKNHNPKPTPQERMDLERKLFKIEREFEKIKFIEISDFNFHKLELKIEILEYPFEVIDKI